MELWVIQFCWLYDKVYVYNRSFKKWNDDPNEHTEINRPPTDSPKRLESSRDALQTDRRSDPFEVDPVDPVELSQGEQSRRTTDRDYTRMPFTSPYLFSRFHKFGKTPDVNPLLYGREVNVRQPVLLSLRLGLNSSSLYLWLKSTLLVVTM